MSFATFYGSQLISFWMALNLEMVEAAGIEPASGNGPRQITTCLAFIQF